MDHEAINAAGENSYHANTEKGGGDGSNSHRIPPGVVHNVARGESL